MAIRVLVVDDSVVIRRLVVQALESDPGIEVAGTAANGQLAQSKFEQLRPDVITMDVEMPIMNGVEAVRALRAKGVRVPIIMFSTLTARGATATLDALAAGATDYVTKPANVGSVQESLKQVAEQLGPKIRALAPRSLRSSLPAARRGAPAGSPEPVVRKAVTLPRAPTHPVRAVVVGSSTGGPEALSRLVSGLQKPLPVPMFVVQHMPPVFTAQLAARLDRMGPSTVVEATDGMVPRAGTIYIAPGDWHMVLAGRSANTHVKLHQEPPVNFCRPSVDVTFQSVLACYGKDILGVVLTGMGSDGKVASGEIVQAGGTVISQDEQTSVVWGMPGAVAAAGATHRILPIDEIAQAITARVTRADQFIEGRTA